jgi:peptide subunit release factor RF-3
MRAEIASYERNSLKGVLHSLYLKKPYVFNSLVQMIEKMEEIFDTKGFPEAFLTPRTFGSSKKNTKKLNVDGDEDIMDTNIQFAPGDSKCTFEITVKFRQNATWQGQIFWAEKNLKQNFRSVLEMLKLMDEALTDNSSKAEPIKWDEQLGS